MNALQHDFTAAQLQAPPSAAPASGKDDLRPHVTIRGLSKRVGHTVIYDNFDLDIPRGELITVFGPNGCGKSTLINMVAGLVPRDAGQVLFDGMLLSEIKFGYVFQNYREALFPWLRAFDNIAYPLKLMKVAKAERKARVERLVERLGIRLDLKQYPYQMSGGQQQLVSILRALVVEPEILFLDEPFSALDYEMTLFMREQLQAALHRNANDHHRRLARSGGGGLPRRPDPAAVAPSRPGRRFRSLRCATPAHGCNPVGSRVHQDQSALPRSLPARGSPHMKPNFLDPLPSPGRRCRA